MYIAIAGNIGAGKTTLTKMLAKYYGWEPRFESVSFNPYLEDYYSDIQRWAFCLETYFLKERFKDMMAVQKASHTIVQDRSIFEGVYVFVRNNYERGDLSERDFTTFMELFDLMKSQMKMPDMMIYLRKSVPALIAQIQKRGRDYEQSMQIDYLKDLNEKYEDFYEASEKFKAGVKYKCLTSLNCIGGKALIYIDKMLLNPKREKDALENDERID